MKYSDFEKNMGKKLRSHKVDLDTTEFYNSIKNQQKRKRRGAIIIYLPALLLGLILSGYGYNYLFNSSNQSTNEKYSSNLIDSEASLAKAQFVKQESLEIHSKSATLDYTQSIKKEKTSKSNNININNEITSQQTKQSTELNTNNISTSTSIKIEKAGEYEQINSSDGSNVLNPDDAINDEKISTDQLENNLNNALDNEEVNLTQSLSISLASIGSKIPSLLKADDTYVLNTDIKCPDFRINKSRLNIEILADAGYFLPLKSFQDNSIEVNEVNQLRRVHEKSREGYHAGIYAKFSNAKWPVYVQAGLSQDHITERMKLEYNYTRMDTTQGIISITTSENGDTITAIIGDIITETEVSGRKIKHYRLRTIDVPVTVGYSLPLNRFTLDIEGGVLFNLGMRNTGSILADQNNFDDVEVMTPFKSRIGISYLGGISLGYHLTPRSKLYLNTKFRIIPDEFNRINNSLIQKYNLAGLNVGYGYTF